MLRQNNFANTLLTHTEKCKKMSKHIERRSGENIVWAFCYFNPFYLDNIQLLAIKIYKKLDLKSQPNVLNDAY